MVGISFGMMRSKDLGTGMRTVPASRHSLVGVGHLRHAELVARERDGASGEFLGLLERARREPPDVLRGDELEALGVAEHRMQHARNIARATAGPPNMSMKATGRRMVARKPRLPMCISSRTCPFLRRACSMYRPFAGDRGAGSPGAALAVPLSAASQCTRRRAQKVCLRVE
jgi:hypothetical protein